MPSKRTEIEDKSSMLAMEIQREIHGFRVLQTLLQCWLRKAVRQLIELTEVSY